MKFRLTKQKYKDRKTGKEVIPKNWSLDFTDHLGRRQRLSLRASNKNVAQIYAENIESIVAYKASNRPFSAAVYQWLEKMPEPLTSKLASIGLLDKSEFALTKTLKKHLKDWKSYLQDCDNTEKHINQQYKRVKRIIEGCKFIYFTDIKESVLLAWLMRQRSARPHHKGPISNSTRNHHIRAIKSFCNWAVMEARIIKSPLASMKFLKSDIQLRRALTPKEVKKLLLTTYNRPVILGVSGNERALIYRVAIETGLRAGELKSLTRMDINFKNCHVILKGEYTKNRQTARLPLRKMTCKLLKAHIKDKSPDDRIFNIPYKQALMIKQDYKAAGIDPADNGNGKLDFHSLRHTFGTMLAQSGAHPKVAQQLMRHSKIELTMNIYTHVNSEQTRKAINALPTFA